MSSALAAIDRHGPLTPSELAAHERVQRPTATRVLARLEELGLIERAPDPVDRRSSLITASTAGARCYAASARARTSTSRAASRPWSADEVATLDRAAAILERMLDEEGRR